MWSFADKAIEMDPMKWANVKSHTEDLRQGLLVCRKNHEITYFMPAHKKLNSNTKKDDNEVVGFFFLVNNTLFVLNSWQYIFEFLFIFNL